MAENGRTMSEHLGELLALNLSMWSSDDSQTDRICSADDAVPNIPCVQSHKTGFMAQSRDV